MAKLLHLWWLCQKILCILCLAIPRVWSCHVNPCLHHLEVQLVDSSTLNVWHVWEVLLFQASTDLISGVTQSHRIRRISESFLQNVADLT